MFLFVRKVVLPFKVLVSSLVLHSGASFAQMDSVAHQHSVSQSAPLQPYRMPQGINSQGAIEESVSSGEFERFIAVPLPQESLSRAVINNPSPLPSVQTASPFELANSPSTQISPNLPPESIRYIPWWQNRCASPLFAAAPEFACRVDLEQLIWQSMQHSPGVQSILIVPQIQRTEQQIAQGEFDPRRFGQSNYHNTSDPIGNTLTTGGPPRLNEDFWENSVGIRDRNVLGGKTELAQLLNAKNNNSLFFKPNNQADAKLSLNYTQPLMRGSGKFYNTSSIQIASIRTQASIAEANRKLQDHVLNIVSAYWDLTLYRNLLVQSQNGQLRLQQIKQQLENRTGRDLLPAHVSRAHAAIQAQQGQIANAIYNIKKQEAILRSLVNSPEMEGGQCREIIPLTSPEVGIPDVPIEEELYAAIFYRGDIVALQQAIENAVVQRQLAVNELRPTLDLIAGGYVHGLRGNNQIAEAWGNQFSGTPSANFGLNFLNPAGNRSAKANLTKSQKEVAKILLDYKNALLKAQASITSAVEATKGTYASALAAIEGTLASKEEVEGHQARLQDFFGDHPSVSNILNDLLDAEGRLIQAENAWATRQVQHMQALAQIKYETGTLMAITAE